VATSHASKARENHLDWSDISGYCKGDTHFVLRKETESGAMPKVDGVMQEVARHLSRGGRTLPSHGRLSSARSPETDARSYADGKLADFGDEHIQRLRIASVL